MKFEQLQKTTEDSLKQMKEEADTAKGWSDLIVDITAQHKLIYTHFLQTFWKLLNNIYSTCAL